MGAVDSTASAPSARRDRLIVIALLAVALVWRLVYFFEMQASPYGGTLTLDSQLYHELALAAAGGDWSPGETFFQAPLYPWLLGIVYSLAGPSQTLAKLLQIALGVISCWLVFQIANRVFDRTVATVALAISSVYGMHLYFANELLVVTLIVFLDLLGLDLLLRAADSDRVPLWAASGLAFGLSAIARPTILPFVAAAVGWIVIGGRRAGAVRPAVHRALLFTVAVALPIAPVTLHNWLAGGDLVLVAANGGVNFYIGNNPSSDGITAAVPGTRPDRWGGHEDQVRLAREALGNDSATPAEVSDYWYGQAWQHIRSHPARALRHTLYKALVLINAHEVSNNRVIGFVTRHSRISSWATVSFWIVLPLAAAGIVFGAGRRRFENLLLIFVAVYSATIVPFFVNARFRMPVAAVFVIFAAAAVVVVARRLRVPALDRRLVSAILVALITAVVIRPLPALRVPDAQAFFNEAEAYRAHGDFTAAATWYQAALDAFPAYCDAAFNLAQIHARVVPDPVRVVEVLEGVEESCAGDVGIRRLLGLSLLAIGRHEDGIEHLRWVAENSPGSKRARDELDAALAGN